MSVFLTLNYHQIMGKAHIDTSEIKEDETQTHSWCLLWI